MMNARIAEIARNLRRRGSPAAAVAPQAIVEVASPEVEPQSEPSDRYLSRSRLGHLQSRQPSSPQVLAGLLRSPLVAQKRQVVMLPGSKASQASQRNASVRTSVVAKRRVPTNLASDRVSEQNGVRPRTQLRKKRTPNTSRISSVVRTLVGQDSFELYKTSCLDRDQVLLAQTAHTRVEEHLAHVLMQASAFGHNLALKCSMFQNDKADAEKRIRELEQGLETAKAAEKEALEAKAAVDAQVAALGTQLSATIEEGKKQVAAALEQGRIDGFFAGRLAGKTEGIIEGRETFLQLDDYKQSLASARLQGARDFLKSPVFKTAVEVQSAQFLNDGFDKCIAQVAHLQGFVEGFD
ncbi:hypothetical protein Salat_1098300 [Sesamum alatum]|uniref:Uncharacterized protein n=1 Tax=Sesamum alatum TaxID=300844 RepID=A0AAE1YN95_9LAMI|nr:hypothetical protein Salat_1098300 [Sesamum alatum]